MSLRFIAPALLAFLAPAAQAQLKPADLAQGQRLAEELTNSAAESCISCHGMPGGALSEDDIRPNLAGQWQKYLQRQMRAYQGSARKGELVHNGLSDASEQDVLDLSAWFASLPAAPAPVLRSDSELVSRGQALYQQGSVDQGVVPCMVCHGPAGEGKAYLSYPYLRGQPASYLALQLQRFRDGERAGWEESYLGNVMHAIAKPLSDRDIDALAAYLHQLR